VVDEIAFQRLRRQDFPLLVSWLSEPLVRRWWNQDTTEAALERDFGASVDGRDRAEICLALIGEEPFGLIQRYPIADTAEHLAELAALLPVPPGALSVDYFIGESGFRGRGLGPRMIAAFVADAWSAWPGARDVIVPVSAANRASWRALERAGFVRVAEGELKPDNPVDSRDHVVYAARRVGG